ncbi:MAG TPA: zf-HC2 domain-containing protein [Acidobacteriota bacterium]
MSAQESHDFIMPLLPAYELNLLEEEDREEVESHVRKCNECFENLYHFAPISTGLQRLKEQRIRKREERAPRLRSSWQWLMALFMAMLLVMSFWILRQSTNIQKDVMRGAAQIQLLQPSNNSEVRFPMEFRWEEEPEAEYYKIFIFRNAKMTVQGERVNIPVYHWNDSSVDDGTYEWKVESYFSNGTRIRDSITNKFRLRK